MVHFFTVVVFFSIASNDSIVENPEEPSLELFRWDSAVVDNQNKKCLIYLEGNSVIWEALTSVQARGVCVRLPEDPQVHAWFSERDLDCSWV